MARIFRIVQCGLVLLAAIAVVSGAEPFWRVKQPADWSADDSRLLLVGSPWVRKAAVAIIPERRESQLREGWKMGGGAKGGGLDSLPPNFLTGGGGSVQPKQDPVAEFAETQAMTIRWESAMAVRIAELKAGETGAPDWDGEYYVIAVYDVPGLASLDKKVLQDELKKMAALKREGKKEINPARVDVVPVANKLARVLFFFSRSSGITSDDKRIDLVAQIGRFNLSQYFLTDEMQMQGKLEL